MNKTEIKLEQNKADQARLKDEQKRLEKELEKSKRLKLRHGECGMDGSQKWLKLGDKVIWAHRDDKLEVSGHPDCFFEDVGIFAIRGNIKDYFDDLKRNAEDLETFRKRLWGGNTLRLDMRVELANSGVAFWVENEVATASLEEAVEIHQKLGQMIATIKRRKNE